MLFIAPFSREPQGTFVYGVGPLRPPGLFLGALAPVWTFFVPDPSVPSGRPEAAIGDSTGVALGWAARSVGARESSGEQGGWPVDQPARWLAVGISVAALGWQLAEVGVMACVLQC